MTKHEELDPTEDRIWKAKSYTRESLDFRDRQTRAQILVFFNFFILSSLVTYLTSLNIRFFLYKIIIITHRLVERNK